MAFDPSDNYDENRVCLKVEGEVQGRSVEAYSCADAEGCSYYDNGDVLEGATDETHGAPFDVDVVFHDDDLSLGEIRDIRRELGTEFEAQFKGKVDKVFEQIEGEENPLQKIMDLDSEELGLEPTGDSE